MIVSGPVARSVGLDSFADLTPVPVAAITRNGIEFDGDLTTQQQADVWARMTSRDDTDQAARANLACLRDAIAGTDPASLALVAAINYVLGV